MKDGLELVKKYELRKIYPSNKVHNLNWKNVIYVSADVYDKEEINSYYYSLPILELKLWVPADCEITFLSVLLPNVP